MSAISERLTTALADRYRIERELGAGGMATVYLAQDLKHHRKVAIKVLRPEHDRDRHVTRHAALHESRAGDGGSARSPHGPMSMRSFYRSYDVHPDGKRFLMLNSGDAEARSLSVIFNWRPELQRVQASPP
jgi:serine/threonine protein kinase